MTVSNHGASVIKWLPKDKILIESDSPFAKFENMELEPTDSYRMTSYLSSSWNCSEGDGVRATKVLNVLSVLSGLSSIYW
ncbi:MAG: hypothetical protein JKX81_03795 [Arenicella sp.]|nr:hypothetical protein [Arenicella sp.]